jgi:integrase
LIGKTATFVGFALELHRVLLPFFTGSEGIVTDISKGFIRKVGANYYMVVNVDGIRKQKKTGTDDEAKAKVMLHDWRRDIEHGIREESNHRYEEMRDTYLSSGKEIHGGARRDLDAFFKNRRVSMINPAMIEKFKTWRENQPEVLEYKKESVEKEVEWSVRQAEEAGVKLTPEERRKVEDAATRWVENGVKATTNQRLKPLRAMFNYFYKCEEIDRVPHIPFYPNVSVDNVRQGTVSEADANRLLEKLPENLRGIFEFIYMTGMRSGAARQLTWEMVDKDCTTLTIPRQFMKNKEPMTLPLIDEDGEPLYLFVRNLKQTFRRAGRIFPLKKSYIRVEWQKACNKLGLGHIDNSKHYRGLRLHDLRRTALGNMRKNGVPESVAMTISGHKTASIFRRYSIVDLSEKQAALSKVPRLKPKKPARVVAMKNSAKVNHR